VAFGSAARELNWASIGRLQAAPSRGVHASQAEPSGIRPGRPAV